MLLTNPLFIETERNTWDNLTNFLSLPRSCWKCSSILWMQSNNFPVLASLILSKWTQQAEVAVSLFRQERNFSELLVRIEHPGKRWTRRRGGYTIPVSAVRSLVDELIADGMLALLLEPAKPYSDLYSLTSLCDLVTGTIDVEVVGPGFDASDLLRSDIVPHERFDIRFREPQDFQVRRSQLIEPNTYRLSVQRRLAKIGARLRNPPFPDEALEASAANSHSNQLADEAMRYLDKSGQTLLLNHLEEYEPIPEAFLTQLRRLIRAMVHSQVTWEALSVSASFLDHGRLVMWDFFPSPGNRDTRLLSAVRAV